MFNILKKQVADRGHLCLFCVKLTDILSLAENLSPEETVEFLLFFLSTYEKSIRNLGGYLVRSESNCIISEWPDPENKGAIEFITIAQSLLNQKKHLQNWNSAITTKLPHMVISISRGECIFERQKRNRVQIYGLILNHVEQIMSFHDGTEDAIIFDQTLVDSTTAPFSTPLRNNVYILTKKA